MDKNQNVEKLKEAVEAERLRALDTPEYKSLLKAMAEYNEGKGPPPSVDRFAAWVESVAVRQRERNSDFGALEP